MNDTTTTTGMPGRSSPWYDGVFDAMEDAVEAHSRGERLPSEAHTMFWAWANESFQTQARRAAEEVTHELEQEAAAQRADGLLPFWNGEIWRAMGARCYATGYAWALQVEVRRLRFGGAGVLPEDREAYALARVPGYDPNDPFESFDDYRYEADPDEPQEIQDHQEIIDDHDELTPHQQHDQRPDDVLQDARRRARRRLRSLRAPTRNRTDGRLRHARATRRESPRRTQPADASAPLS